MAWLDHLVMSCAALPEGEAHLAQQHGLSVAGGGQHAAMSTHNRLMSLGPQEYFELIATDPSAPPPPRKRWFALDRFSGPPRLTNWVIACDNLDAALALAPAGSGRAMALSRADLRWQMAVPETGELPFDNVFPALIAWEGPAHPAPRLPDTGTRLTALVLRHPDPEGLRTALAPLFSDPRLHIVQGPPAIEAELQGPQGTIRL